jgi:hypothetical protein
VRAVVLGCAVAGADGGGGLWCPEPIMKAACMHVWDPHQAMWRCSVIRSNKLYFFIEKHYYSNGPY